MGKGITSKLIESRAFSLTSGILLSIALGFFAYRHIEAYIAKGDISLLVIVVAETLTASLFLFRSAPKSVSANPYDWVVAIVGSFAAVFFTPSSYGLIPEASIVIIGGTIVQILAIASLNRSFAIVAAVRIVKTDKMYQFVRHPIYFSYCIAFTGYVLAYTSYWNLGVYAVVIILFILRILREEQQLSQEPSYREYMRRVRYRLVPFVF